MHKSHLFLKIIFSFVVLLYSVSVCAQEIKIEGIITDSITLQPIDGVVVKALDGNKMLAFGISNNLGEYKLNIKTETKTFKLFFQHLAYHIKIQNASNKSQKINLSLSSKEVSLREVSVKAPEILLKKDTISYNVGSFTSASDRSIEDVLKKLPGVKVADNGKISYQGQDISKFNIEGLDMLGGKYSLATRNVQAKDVNRVEIKENYQEIKQLEGKEYSDKVAMNLKLKKEAKMKILGTAEVGGGYREKEGLYHGVLTGMTFRKKGQFIGTVKANNFGEPLAGELVDHYGSYYLYNIADVLIGANLASTPGMPQRTYRQKTDFMSSLNTILKFSDTKNLRINVDYMRDQSRYKYETTSSYFLNNNNVEITEAQSPSFLSNTLKAAFRFNVNSSSIYINNETYLIGRALDNQFGLLTNWNQIEQNEQSEIGSIQNKFSLFKRNAKRNYRFNSNTVYSNMPENSLTFIGVPGTTGAFYQMGKGQTFSTINSTSFGYDLSKISKLSIGVSLRADYDKVFTRLQLNDSSIVNQNDGFKITSSLSPSYRLLSADERYGLTVNLAVSLYSINYQNHINSQADFKHNRPFFSPSLNSHYIVSPYLKLLLNTGLSTNIGDIAEFVIHPIQSSYKQQNTKTGILAITHSYSTNLGLEYKDPLKLFFANGSLNYGNTNRNILNNQTISSSNGDIEINSSAVSDKNITQNVSASGSVSKDVRSISTSFSLRANYGVSTGVQLRQGIKSNIKGNNFSISPNIRTTLVKKLELNYWMSYSENTQRSTNFNSTFHNQSHGLSLDYNPIKSLIVYSKINYSRLEITSNQFKDMKTFDAGIRYKLKKFEAELKLNNLLNTKVYNYSVFNQLDRFTYTYHLNPREIVAICKFSL